MITETDLEYLREAVSLAERGLFTTTPNPRVGCVIVRNGRVLGRGWHAWCGEAHAEVNAIRDAGGDVAGATVYVSLEPCTVDGRTPPCVDALIAAGVKRVVAGAPDPDPRVNGSGFDRLCAAGIETENADLADALRLNAGHRQRIAEGRPMIRIKMAASLDGRTAMASGESQWITGVAARQDVQYWRARSCAVLTGIGTLLADDPRLNVRDEAYAVHGRLRPPLRVIADSRMRTPPDARFFEEDGGVLIAHAGDPDAEHSKAECAKCGDGKVDLGALVNLLADRPCNEVLVEAGPTLAGALIDEGLWDELLLYLAPRLLGSTARPLIDRRIERLGDTVSGRIRECVQVGEDLRVRLVRED
ncbi:MAG: bifunctional diaminohydroxyphosphoribosylaminopyrimidine deaminase/5-amino-6-(5-phosphoribosylamino)uracil reductase RibD [Gammaproteobacteria bacterium]|nr:bifunctional diaminohydroxyphosphoribosylaminopyrimidine deaminase/5-amino-6-(5-phosphoribosylamino)uracil reductase RibD [Gammaproteobacteria bacterium]